MDDQFNKYRQFHLKYRLLLSNIYKRKIIDLSQLKKQNKQSCRHQYLLNNIPFMQSIETFSKHFYHKQKCASLWQLLGYLILPWLFENQHNLSKFAIIINLIQSSVVSKNTIIVDPGYWRINTTSYVLTPCNFERNCVGGMTNNLCNIGHSGALCDSCDSTGSFWNGTRYTRSSANNCLACYPLKYPMLFFSLYAIIKIIQQKIIKQRVQRGTFIVAGIFILLYFQPNLVDTSMGLITCRFVQGVHYINDDTNQRCYSDLHNKYVQFVCIPTLLIFVGVIPLSTISILFKRRKIIQVIKTKFDLGYFLIGYSDENSLTIYWELVQMFKKMASIFLLNYFSNTVQDTFTDTDRQKVQKFWRIAYNMVLKRGGVVSKDIRKSVVFSKMFSQHDERKQSNALMFLDKINRSTRNAQHLQDSQKSVKSSQKIPVSIKIFYQKVRKISNRRSTQSANLIKSNLRRHNSNIAIEMTQINTTNQTKSERQISIIMN